MCSLVGFLGLGKKEDFAKGLLVAGQIRGTHATGYVEIGKDGKSVCYKDATAAAEFVKDMKFELDTVSFLGHTRYGTCGDIKNPHEAHPFEGDRWSIMHNGWISRSDYESIKRKYDLHPKTPVDSEIFLTFLEKFNDINKLRDEMLPLISEQSKYMVIIYDRQEQVVHMIRDDRQDFCFYREKDVVGLAYASTPAILQKAIGRKLNNVIHFDAWTHSEYNALTGEFIKKTKIARPVTIWNDPNWKSSPWTSSSDSAAIDKKRLKKYLAYKDVALIDARERAACEICFTTENVKAIKDGVGVLGTYCEDCIEDASDTKHVIDASELRNKVERHGNTPSQVPRLPSPVVHSDNPDSKSPSIKVLKAVRYDKDSKSPNGNFKTRRYCIIPENNNVLSFNHLLKYARSHKYMAIMLKDRCGNYVVDVRSGKINKSSK